MLFYVLMALIMVLPKRDSRNKVTQKGTTPRTANPGKSPRYVTLLERQEFPKVTAVLCVDFYSTKKYLLS